MRFPETDRDSADDAGTGLALAALSSGVSSRRFCACRWHAGLVACRSRWSRSRGELVVSYKASAARTYAPQVDANGQRKAGSLSIDSILAESS